jgi:hypothetical protein
VVRIYRCHPVLRFHTKYDRKYILYTLPSFVSVLRIRSPVSYIRDPVHFLPLDPGSGKGIKSRSGTGGGMNIPDHIS